MNKESLKDQIKATMKSIGEIYPAIKTKDGQIIDGRLRLEIAREEGREWPTFVVTKPLSKKEFILAKIAAHQRRDVPREEIDGWLRELGYILHDEGIKPEDMVNEVSRLTGYSKTRVRMALPSELKGLPVIPSKTTTAQVERAGPSRRGFRSEYDGFKAIPITGGVYLIEHSCECGRVDRALFSRYGFRELPSFSETKEAVEYVLE